MKLTLKTNLFFKEFAPLVFVLWAAVFSQYSRPFSRGVASPVCLNSGHTEAL